MAASPCPLLLGLIFVRKRRREKGGAYPGGLGSFQQGQVGFCRLTLKFLILVPSNLEKEKNRSQRTNKQTKGKGKRKGKGREVKEKENTRWKEG